MSVAFDSSATANAGAAGSLTYSHTCSGANGVLMVGVVLVDSNARTISSITYNTVALTALYDYVPSTNRRVAMYYLVGPATGAHNIVITLSASVSNNIVSSSTSYAGVSQVGFPDASNKNEIVSGSPTTITTSVTTVADNAWLAGFEWNNQSGTVTAGTNTMKRTSSTYGNGFMDGYDSNAAESPAGSYSLQVNTNSGSGNAMSLMVASLAPAIAVSIPLLSLLGAGT